jgi:hypothetical protein
MNSEVKQAITEALAKRSEFEHRLIIKAWENEAFRQELVANPKEVYAREVGRELPENLQIEIVEEPPETVKLVLPQISVASEADEELSDEKLEAVAGGGVTVMARIGVRF